jgi:tRNA(Arg) A34 adenosine deaminase TadA
MTDQDRIFMTRAIELAKMGVEMNLGGPFGCVVVKDDVIVGEGNNRVTSTNDPTAHAEIVAIREACTRLDAFQLDGCTIYTSCEPCPMCLGAIYWARPARVFFACTREDAAAAGFDDELIYNELAKPNAERERVMINLLREDGVKLFQAWAAKLDKVEY